MKYLDYKEVADYIKSKINCQPKLAIVLGTALGGLADEVKDPVVIDYSDIPHFLKSTNKDHAGKMIIGKLFGKDVVCMSGRFHYYEGYDFTDLGIYVRVLKLLGIEDLILTNASGGVNKDFYPGDAMIITDHINFMGVSPTRGLNMEEFGSRFFDMSNAYNKDLIKIADSCIADTELTVRKGIYFFASGPQFETPAEINAMRILGADAVGMSTVPEVIAAAHCGIRVLGISLITNMAAGVFDEPIDGSEVEEVGRAARANLAQYLKLIIEKM